MKKAEIAYNTELKEMEKLQAQLERRTKTYEKKLAIAEKLGVANWSNDDRRKWLETVEIIDNMYIANKEDIKKNGAWFDLLRAKDDLAETKSKIERCEKRLAEKKAEYDKVKEEEAEDFVDINEIPKALLEAKDYLVETWVAWDIAERDRIKKLRAELSYKEFRDKVKYSHEMEYTKSDEEFRKQEEKEAEIWLLDLYRRVRDITGTVTDASGIRWGGKCLDGIIKGEKGTAVVETIVAGGWNIQRLHLRTLVKEF